VQFSIITGQVNSGAQSGNVFTATPVAGDLVIAALRDNSGSVTSVPDFSNLSGIANSAGWQYLGGVLLNNGKSIELWWCYASGTSNKLTATTATGSQWRISGEDWPDTAVVTGSFTTANGASTAPALTIDPTAANQTAFAAMFASGAVPTAGPASPWNDNPNTDTVEDLTDCYQTVTASGAVTATWTLASSHTWGTVGCILYPYFPGSGSFAGSVTMSAPQPKLVETGVLSASISMSGTSLDQYASGTLHGSITAAAAGLIDVPGSGAVAGSIHMTGQGVVQVPASGSYAAAISFAVHPLSQVPGSVVVSLTSGFATVGVTPAGAAVTSVSAGVALVSLVP